MSTITRERAKDILEFGAGRIISPITDGEIMELARIALASLEAEPVAWDYERASCITCEGPQGFKRVIEHEYPPEWAIEEGRARNIVPLYTAPPAPVSVPDEVTAEDCPAFVKYDITEVDEAWARGFNQCRDAMLQGADSNSPVIQDCSCHACRPVTFTDSRFVVCPVCGNKRCPHANDHRNACTGSNEPGQEGSAYPAAPQQEAKP